MYSIRFADGAEIEAWLEEVESASAALSPVDRLCQYGHKEMPDDVQDVFGFAPGIAMWPG
jgi:hypothetical protein